MSIRTGMEQKQEVIEQLETNYDLTMADECRGTTGESRQSEPGWREPSAGESGQSEPGWACWRHRIPRPKGLVNRTCGELYVPQVDGMIAERSQDLRMIIAELKVATMHDQVAFLSRERDHTLVDPRTLANLAIDVIDKNIQKVRWWPRQNELKPTSRRTWIVGRTRSSKSQAAILAEVYQNGPVLSPLTLQSLSNIALAAQFWCMDETAEKSPS